MKMKSTLLISFLVAIIAIQFYYQTRDEVRSMNDYSSPIPVFAYELLSTLSRYADALPSKIRPPPFWLQDELVGGYTTFKAIHVAAELDIAEVLGDSQLSTAELSKRCHLVKFTNDV